MGGGGVRHIQGTALPTSLSSPNYTLVRLSAIGRSVYSAAYHGRQKVQELAHISYWRVNKLTLLRALSFHDWYLAASCNSFLLFLAILTL